jgi:hypothetical protein
MVLGRLFTVNAECILERDSGAKLKLSGAKIMMRNILAILLLLCGSVSMRAADIVLASGVSMAPGDSVALPLSLANPARIGGVTVTLSSSDTSKVTVSPDNVYIPEGATTPYSQPRVTGVSFGSATITASAYGLAGTTQIVNVSGRLSGPQSQTIQRGATVQVMLALSSPTPIPITLSVSSDNPSAASVPATVAIPANGTTAIVPVTGVSAGATLVHVSALPNVAEFLVNISVQAPGNITLSPVSMSLGQSTPFPVTLGAPAPHGGVVVTLASSDTHTAHVSPASVFIPEGATAPAAQPQVTADNIGVASITAAAAEYLTASQQVVVTATITMSPQTLSIPVGGTQILSMMLSSAAPSPGIPITPDRAADGFVPGLTVQLTSSDPSVATVQPTVLFYGDGSSVTTVVVVVSGVRAGTAVIHASALPAIPDATATVIVGGGGTSGPSSIAPAGGTPQAAQVGTPYGLPLSAVVRNATSAPVVGATVTFTAPASGPGITFAGGVNTAVTDALGVARSQTVIANSVPGTFQVTASVAGLASTASFTLTNTTGQSGSIALPANVTVGTGQATSFPVTLSSPAPAGGVTVSLTSSDTSRLTIAPANVFIGGGATTPSTQPQVTGINFGLAAVSASAAGYSSASQTVQVSGTLSFAPPALTINGLGTQSMTLLLSSIAPQNGLQVSLSSINPGVATVPSTVTIPAGGAMVSIPVTAIGVGHSVITASAVAPNIPNAAATITVNLGSDIVLGSGVSIAPGDSVGLPLSLTSPARIGGVTVTLSSSDPSKAKVSSDNVYIPEGATVPFAQARIIGVSFGSATISASAYGLTGGSELVQVSGKLSGPQSQSIQRGTTSQLMFALSSPTVSALVLSVSTDNPSVATVPATATIPANGSIAVVPVTGVNPGVTVLRVSALPDVAEFAVNINVQAPGNITLSAVSMSLGQSAPFPVTLGTPAPLGGVVVTLSSSDPFTVHVSPGSVFIPAGATAPSAQPQVSGDNIGVVSITATAPGYLTASQQAVVTATITMSPQTLTIPVGGTQILSMMLSSAAPSPGIPVTPDRGSQGFVPGLTLQLTSSDPKVATVQPTVQFYSDGSSITTVVVVVSGVGPGTAVIHASALPAIPDATATVVVH